MRNTTLLAAVAAVAIGLVLPTAASLAQSQPGPGAPAAGSGGGGPVGPSISGPREPTGAVPPGTPQAPQARDAAGTAVIGKTATSGDGAPGQTDGKESGVGR